MKILLDIDKRSNRVETMGFITFCLIICLSSNGLAFKAITPEYGDSTNDISIENQHLDLLSAEFNHEMESRTNHVFQDSSPASLKDCEHLSIPGKTSIQRRLREIHSRDFSFFVKIHENFVRLIIEPKIEDIYETSRDVIELYRSDLTSLSNDQNDWIEIRVQYFQRLKSMRPDSIGLRVTVDGSDYFLTTNYWALLNEYEGFVVSAEGGLEVLFYCHPELYFDDELPASTLWLIAGCFLSFMLILIAMFCIAIVLIRSRIQQQQKGNVVSPSSGVYEEFNEEMLNRIQQKVRVLREGRASESSDSGRNENIYVDQRTLLNDLSKLQSVTKDQKSSIDDHNELTRSSEEYHPGTHSNEAHYSVPQSNRAQQNVLLSNAAQYKILQSNETDYNVPRSTENQYQVPRLSLRNYEMSYSNRENNVACGHGNSTAFPKQNPNNDFCDDGHYETLYS